MSAKNTPEPDTDDGSSEPDVSAEEVRDLFIDEERLDVSTIAEEFEIEEESHVEDLLDRLIQSGIIEKKGRSAVKGGTYWILKNPQLRVRSASEIANESPLAGKVNLSGDPRDEEVDIEDALDLLAQWEERRADLSTTRGAVKLQITARHARDLLDELVDRGVADRLEPDGGGANAYWLSDSFSADDVEQLLHDPDPEPAAVDQLDEAIND